MLFADAAVTAIASHQITFFFAPFTRSRSRAAQSQSLIVCFFRCCCCLKFHHFNVFAMNFHAIICLCSKPESERVIALLHFFFERRRRLFFLWIFLIGISEAEITNRTNIKWNQRIKIVNGQMRINGEWSGKSTEKNLIDPFYLFARMHIIPFFSEWVIEEGKSW